MSARHCLALTCDHHRGLADGCTATFVAAEPIDGDPWQWREAGVRPSAPYAPLREQAARDGWDHSPDVPASGSDFCPAHHPGRGDAPSDQTKVHTPDPEVERLGAAGARDAHPDGATGAPRGSRAGMLADQPLLNQRASDGPGGRRRLPRTPLPDLAGAVTP